jgi:hypothetical protein
MNLSESTSSTNLEKTGYLKGFDGFVKTVICTNTNIKQCIYSSYVAKKSMGGGAKEIPNSKSFFSLFFLKGVGFELRASCLLIRHYHLSISTSLFMF